MTLKDLTLVMSGDAKIVVEYKAENIFKGCVDEFYNNDIYYQGKEVDTSQFLQKVVSHIFYNTIYAAIWIEIED